MKILIINNGEVIFDNGSSITFDHKRDCCENNYADFEQIEDFAREYEFDQDLRFEKVDNYGFRFGDRGMMFFVPCYSEQNGYYASDLDIIYKGKVVFNLDCERKIY